jgi:hypothetical protein
MLTGSSLKRAPLAGTEACLACFADLLAAAISNADSRAGITRLANEQAALRRVATLVARGAPAEEVFAAVAEEVVQLLPVDSASMCRYESDGTLTFVAQWGSVVASFPVGSRWTLGGHNLGTLVFETGRPGSTAMPIAPRARSVPASARRASARRSRRRSSSRAASGA